MLPRYRESVVINARLEALTLGPVPHPAALEIAEHPRAVQLFAAPGALLVGHKFWGGQGTLALRLQCLRQIAIRSCSGFVCFVGVFFHSNVLNWPVTGPLLSGSLLLLRRFSEAYARRRLVCTSRPQTSLLRSGSQWSTWMSRPMDRSHTAVS